jgi:hypothetical protein
MKEIRIRHDDEELQDPQRITQLNQRLLAAEFEGDLEAIHKHEVHEVIDDFDKGLRVLKVRKRKYFFT